MAYLKERRSFSPCVCVFLLLFVSLILGLHWFNSPRAVEEEEEEEEEGGFES